MLLVVTTLWFPFVLCIMPISTFVSPFPESQPRDYLNPGSLVLSPEKVFVGVEPLTPACPQMIFTYLMLFLVPSGSYHSLLSLLSLPVIL